MTREDSHPSNGSNTVVSSQNGWPHHSEMQAFGESTGANVVHSDPYMVSRAEELCTSFGWNGAMRTVFFQCMEELSPIVAADTRVGARGGELLATSGWVALLRQGQSSSSSSFHNSRGLFLMGGRGPSSKTLPVRKLLVHTGSRLSVFWDIIDSYTATLRSDDPIKRVLINATEKRLRSYILFSKYESLYSSYFVPRSSPSSANQVSSPFDVFEESPTQDESFHQISSTTATTTTSSPPHPTTASTSTSTAAVGAPPSSSLSSPSFSPEFAFGWLLFCTAKESLLGESPDLLSSYDLLLCCVAFLYQCVTDPLRRLVTTTDKPQGNVVPPEEILDVLISERSSSSESEVKAKDITLRDYIQHLHNTQFLRCGSSSSYMHLNGLLETHFMANMRGLVQEYEALYRKYGEPDERLLLERDTEGYIVRSCLSFLSSSSSTEETDSSIPSTTTSHYTVLQYSRHPPTVPHKDIISLKDFVNKLRSADGSTLDEALHRFFRCCDTDPTESIVARSKNMLDVLFSVIPDTSAVRAHINDLVLPLSYRVLASMLIAEEKRVKSSNFTGLLNNDLFHRGLFCCAAEAVMYAITIPDLDPEALKSTHLILTQHLSAFNLQPYDLTKVIETFCRHEPLLPRLIRKHLMDIEEQILDSLAWSKGSRVLYILSSSPSTAAASAISSVASSTQLLSSSLPSPATPTPTSKSITAAAGIHALEMFFRKLTSLAHTRLAAFCEALHVPSSFVEQVNEALLYTMANEWKLLEDRHLDQIILCCLYGVCKKLSGDANSPRHEPLKFQFIIDTYLTVHGRSPTSQAVVQDILLDPITRERGTIVNFYNTVFLNSSLKDFILRCSASTSDSPKTPPPTFTPTRPALSVVTGHVTSQQQQQNNTPRRVANLFLSPMKQSRGPLSEGRRPSYSSTANGIAAQTTPRSYTFGESPSRELHRMNADLARPPNSASTPLRRSLLSTTPNYRHAGDGSTDVGLTNNSNNNNHSHGPAAKRARLVQRQFEEMGTSVSLQNPPPTRASMSAHASTSNSNLNSNMVEPAAPATASNATYAPYAPYAPNSNSFQNPNSNYTLSQPLNSNSSLSHLPTNSNSAPSQPHPSSSHPRYMHQSFAASAHPPATYFQPQHPSTSGMMYTRIAANGEYQAAPYDDDNDVGDDMTDDGNLKIATNHNNHHSHNHHHLNSANNPPQLMAPQSGEYYQAATAAAALQHHFHSGS